MAFGFVGTLDTEAFGYGLRDSCWGENGPWLTMDSLSHYIGDYAPALVYNP